MKVKLTGMTKPLNMPEKMNIEEYLIFCTRLSSSNRLNNETAPDLLNYLLKNKHFSPFEMVNLSFEITTSIPISMQLLRHRSFTFQQFSQRYAQVTNLEPVQLRLQAETNRQSSTIDIDDPEMRSEVEQHLMNSTVLYRSLLEKRVAKESARMILPLTTETTLVMNGTLRSWIHFLEQRCDGHAQKEIQDIAFTIRDLLMDECPWTASALGWEKHNADI